MEPRTLTHYLACLAALHGVLTLSAVFCAAMPVPLIASKVSLPAPALAGVALLSCGCCQSTCILLCFPVTAVSARACSLSNTLHSLPGQVRRAGPAPAAGRACQSADGCAQRRLQPGRARHFPHPGPCSARRAPASRSRERSMQHRTCITLHSTLGPAPRMYASRSASHVGITQRKSCMHHAAQFAQNPALRMHHRAAQRAEPRAAHTSRTGLLLLLRQAPSGPHQHHARHRRGPAITPRPGGCSAAPRRRARPGRPRRTHEVGAPRGPTAPPRATPGQPLAGAGAPARLGRLARSIQRRSSLTGLRLIVD